MKTASVMSVKSIDRIVWAEKSIRETIRKLEEETGLTISGVELTHHVTQTSGDHSRYLHRVTLQLTTK
jgi:hypothetical protein